MMSNDLTKFCCELSNNPLAEEHNVFKKCLLNLINGSIIKINQPDNQLIYENINVDKLIQNLKGFLGVFESEAFPSFCSLTF